MLKFNFYLLKNELLQELKYFIIYNSRVNFCHELTLLGEVLNQ